MRLFSKLLCLGLLWLITHTAYAQGNPAAQVNTFGSQNNLTVPGKAQEMFNQAEARIDAKVQAKKIDLRTVLAVGLNKNIDQKVRNFQKEKLDINFDNTFDRFWLPSFKMRLQTSNQRIETLRSSSSLDYQTDKAPAGRFGIEMGEYTVFNWGKDYLEYLNDKNSYKRNKQRLIEQRRILRFALIAQYFRLVKVKQIKNHRREQLRHTSFIHRLARQKLALKRITSQEYYQTRAEYLRAQTLFQEAQEMVIQEDENMANLLGDELNSTYTPLEQLKFVGINTSRSESITLALKQSPGYRQAKVELENAQRSFQKEIRSNLPLPEFKVNLGAYNTYFDKDGRFTEFEAYENGRDVELVASINMTWSIFGDGGFMNSRDRKKSYLDKRIAEEKFFNTKRALEVNIRALYRRIRFLERKSEVSETQLKNARSAFDATLDNYISTKTDFSNLKIALDRTIEAAINYEESKFAHLLLKLELSNQMGLEDFPGSNFENLAER